MSPTVKIWLIIGTVLILLGLILFTVIMALYHWDFSKLSTVKYETNTYPVEEAFTDISINTDTADILFKVTEDNECKVVCRVPEKVTHTVSVQEGILTIKEDDQRKWYEHIGISFEITRLTVYLPKAQYGSLLIHGNTGNIEIPKDFHFDAIDISTNTGRIKNDASAAGTVKLSTNTGDIHAADLSAASFSFCVSTGNITVSDLQCAGDILINVNTGETILSDVTCQNMTTSGNTGKLSLKNVIAAERFSIERSTGDVNFDGCDAGEIFVKTSTGHVRGSLLSDKVFFAEADTGRVRVPKTATGGRCEITTGTGDIHIEIN